MKPIHLKLSGLQSYREPQEIDFAHLCETGLFGIFGPTGSGKSSLLDAITLAMYGKVERAPGGTQGIMNHSEDQLAVSFTFELSGADGPRRFRVERRFKRTGEQTVSNTVSRFVEVTDGGDVVVADKLAEVTRSVEERIGLKMDDFTRAVVLPQGKFAEFLSLRGADRRQMLQRLFHLEQYGDVLSLKLSRRVKENEAALRSLEAERQGLGNAGAEEVEASELRLTEAVRHAEDCRRRLAEAQERFERFGRIRELQAEREERERRRQVLLAAEPEIARLEAALGRSDEAGKLAPALRAWKEASVAAEAKKAAAEAKAARSARAEEAARRSEASDREGAAALEREEPGLREGAERFRRALELEGELGARRRELADWSRRREETGRRLGGRKESLEREQELAAKGQKRQAELQAMLQPLEVRSRERQTLQEAMQRLQALRSAESLRDDAERERAARAAALAAAQQRLAAASKTAADLAAAQRSAAGEIALHLEAMQELALRASGAAEALDRRAAALEDARRSGEIHRLSLSLARELGEGCPCPVCGSLSHPAPAAPQEDGEDGAEEASRALEETRLLQRRAAELAAALRAQAEQDRILLAQSYSLPAEEAFPPAAAAGEAPAGSESARRNGADGDQAAAVGGDQAVPAGLAADGPAAAAMLEELERAAGEAGSRSRELRAAGTRWSSAWQAARQLGEKETASVEAERSWAEQTAGKADELNRRAAALLEAWRQELPGLAPEDTEEASRELRRKDEQAEDIRARLEVSVKFLEDKTMLVQGLREEIAELDKQLVQCESGIQSRGELIREKEERLFQWTEGRPAAGLLEACEERLKGLRAAAEQARALHRQNAEAAMALAQEAAIARQAFESAREHEEQAAGRFGELLSGSPFATAEEALAAALSPGEQERGQALIREHREGLARTEAQLRHIVEKLNGERIGEQEWADARDGLDQAKTADEEALQSRARAERDLEDLRRRHVRWMELEELRAAEEEQRGRLGKLQSCLRGNAFVEYIAEEQLMQVCQAASQRLRYLSKQRYSLEVDSGGGFVIRDDGNGGVKRPVSTLSGGETFLTSLSLALALSAQIQLRGQYPLQFFFLDEGFGTLDPELLDTVITSLERLHNDKLSVGIISHVPELRARLARKLIVVPAEPGGQGSRIVLEKM
ncbi:AAA family ATPase [Paenibacillus glufosinatiresistens]|uniref:AAA family ATPase n=1 Tax=Paenibacillus glufosinatiresistens TaxID=3070657 RepID=UPI00286E313E|nr:AAA family ATPase [Paenibacillus sp. YX.27]